MVMKSYLILLRTGKNHLSNVVKIKSTVLKLKHFISNNELGTPF
jgi:hypothetical protein